MKVTCKEQQDSIMLARSRDKAFLPTVQEHMFVDIYRKVSAYAIGIMSKQLRLANTVRLLPLERDAQDCTDFCMSNFGLPCQHDFLRVLHTDGPYASLNPAEIHAHWFLDKAFVPMNNMSDARIKEPVTKRKIIRPGS